jgi:hypothetical protein
LNDGDSFRAEIDGKTMWIEAHQGGNQGKVVKIKYKIQDIRPASSNPSFPTQSASPDVFRDSTILPSTWKSMTTGSRFKVRQQSDFLFVERILPEEATRSGVLVAAELHKTTNGYSGTETVIAPCSVWSIPRQQWEANRYTFQFAMEFSLFSGTRIEGRAEALPPGSHLDCEKGVYDKSTSWQAFTWIPE